jgi:arabinogalactan oligomer / maltooligosaccharide transport system permease protein
MSEVSQKQDPVIGNPSGGSGNRVETGMVVSRREQFTTLTLRLIIIAVALSFALFPVLFIVSSAINPTGTLSTQSLVPTSVDEVSDVVVNFRALMIDELDTYPFWNWIFNSFIVAGTSTILVVLITALSAYSFSRFRFWGRRQLLLGVLLIQAFPNLLSMVALFLILLEIGRMVETIPQVLPFLDFIDWGFLSIFGLDSVGGLILIYMGGAMGINTWLMKGFFDSVPRDIDESALVDGASHWQIFWSLIFPLVRPILAVVGVLAFVGTFNEFVLARIILRDQENWTLMVGLFNFINSDFNRDWGKFAAGALIAGTPTVILYLSLQNQIVGGLTAGSVKG